MPADPLPPLRVLVCGGRDYANKAAVWRELDVRGVGLVIQGDAQGADALARRWADTFGVPCLSFPAAWFFHGKRAGPIRNAWMLQFGRPDLVLAFPGGRGTADMVKQARAAGVRVVEVPDA